MPFDVCGACSGQITDELDIQCRDGCQLHFHPNCVKIDKNLLNAINISPNLFWLCNSCSSVANLGLLSKVKSLSEEIFTISDELKNIEKTLLKNNSSEIVNVLKPNDNSDVRSLTSCNTKISQLSVRAHSSNNLNNNSKKKNNKHKRNNQKHQNNTVAGSLCPNANIRAAPSNVSLHVAKLHRDTTTTDVISHVSKTLSVKADDL